MSHRQNHFGSTIKTVLGDDIQWDNTKLPLKGCSSKDPTQLRRCRRHKRIEAECLLSLPHGSSFLDCGSHFGDTVLTMAIHARAHDRNDLRFFAFEPCRRKCKFIRSMIRLNNLQGNVRIFNACVGDCVRNVSQVKETKFAKYDGRVAYREEEIILHENRLDQTIHLGYYFNGDNDMQSDSGSESDSSDDDESVSIRMISLDSIKSEILPVGLLHLDVEGWEPQALNGATSILEEMKDTCFIICEVWDDKDRRRRKNAIADNIVTAEDEIVDIMARFPHFIRQEDIIDQDRNLFYSTQS